MGKTKNHLQFISVILFTYVPIILIVFIYKYYLEEIPIEDKIKNNGIVTVETRLSIIFQKPTKIKISVDTIYVRLREPYSYNEIKSIMKNKFQNYYLLYSDENHHRILYKSHLKNKDIVFTSMLVKGQCLLVLDDFGYNYNIDKEFFRVDFDINAAILPGTEYAEKINTFADLHKVPVILHQPMEPRKYYDKRPNPGMIFTSMADEEIHQLVNSNLDEISNAVAVNNHEGSKFTETKNKLIPFLQLCKERNIMVLDSLTSGTSRMFDMARDMGIRAIKRDIFIDNVKEKTYIKTQLMKLLTLSKKRTFAVGIGHSNLTTLEAIKEIYPLFKKNEVAFIKINHIIEHYYHYYENLIN